MINSISLDCVIVQNPGSIVSDMNGDKVMMNIRNGKYYNMGKVGGRIWELVETPHSINKIIVQLTNEYEVELKECEAQVMSFLELLSTEGLIKIEEDSHL